MNIFLQAAPGQEPNMWGTIVMMGAIFLVFYFFMMRPQQKKMKDAKKFREALQKGTRVVTIGGIHGKVVEVDDKTVLLEVDSNVKLRFEKSAISMDSSTQLTEETKKQA